MKVELDIQTLFINFPAFSGVGLNESCTEASVH